MENRTINNIFSYFFGRWARLAQQAYSVKEKKGSNVQKGTFYMIGF